MSAKQRGSPRRPSYFHQMERPGEDAHVIDIAVRQRLPQRAAQERLKRLQARVREQLGKDLENLVALENQYGDIRTEREAAYFDVGYEHGLAEGLSRARSAAGSKLARDLVRDVRERAVQAQLAPGRAALALLECAGAMLLSEKAAPSERAR
jgi:hypothetical protein